MGKSKLQELVHQDQVSVNSIHKKTLWLVEGDYQSVLNSNILANPFSQTVEVLIK
jgi:hypothetical protein